VWVLEIAEDHIRGISSMVNPEKLGASRARDVRDGALEDIDGVARVWAAATAARDGDLAPARLEIARQPILSVMRDEGYLLIVIAAPRIVAFALATPAASEPHRVAEIVYVGVDPRRWGEGLGARVLDSLAKRLPELGYPSAELWVYSDNVRAIRLYEWLGWRASEERCSVHPRTRKPQRRYQLDLTEPARR
jgi:ribosomal protein S18 acetylase RimI-like enzyme